MSGVQRRRINRISNEDESDHSDNDQSRSNVSKVAFDPEEAKIKDDVSVPKLTLMEEVVLLGLGDSEGYLSFWNDNISYVLRGCILIELALRGKIRIIDDSARKSFDLSERLIEVIDASKTGEVLLDETLQLMKNDEPQSIVSWIDLLSGETWNFFKVNYQLKQVRERLSKGLVDKGVLRTEMKNFFLFDMATHPVADSSCKESLKRRIMSTLVDRTLSLQYNEYFPESTTFKVIRTVSLIITAYSANVLENVLNTLEYEKRDKALSRAENLLNNFGNYPFKLVNEPDNRISINLNQLVEDEIKANPKTALQLEVLAGVFDVFAKMDVII
ncbi:hypothetical protein TPHA_0J02610 [Tetrapisispora phaffii CBS 4417]|uniref:Vacuolar protein sorting-associated protein 74 n=1 Tax=Tetrapisispora phaffii (strain ATCC 24235 / CBS 4417 / NBRC 1672 / NRRL Y-8282 / UCD 70-5) TaxID=1071381 RepID=G8BYY9_TETPH|nr:hypothetical protein TPHA_0J02610 [Tetrapisispora phaffii CBS 4417]CCE65081.1 hypothetical protein TPHA_0J02610 [Tetrapisispora phaffii CBS 4417]